MGNCRQKRIPLVGFNQDGGDQCPGLRLQLIEEHLLLALGLHEMKRHHALSRKNIAFRWNAGRTMAEIWIGCVRRVGIVRIENVPKSTRL